MQVRITQGSFQNIQMLGSCLRPIKFEFLGVGFRYLSFLSPLGYPREDQTEWEQWYYGFLLVINATMPTVGTALSQKGLTPHLVTSKNGYTRCRFSASLHQLLVCFHMESHLDPSVSRKQSHFKLYSWPKCSFIIFATI